MTPTDICNQALSLINAGRIRSMTEETEPARQCRLHYDLTRKVLLEQFEWNFARKPERAVLSEHKIDGWAYVYAYPENCVRILAVIPQGERYRASTRHSSSAWIS